MTLSPPSPDLDGSEPSASSARKRLHWQGMTLASLTIGYAGYYICRSNLAVAKPLLLDESSGLGIDKVTIGWIESVAVIFYASGKIFNGIASDFLGGKWVFLGAMIASVLCTILFSLGTGVAVFLVAWSLNRLVQSAGWASMVKITSRWFTYRSFGVAMGIISLSYLGGDAAAKLILGWSISQGFSWQQMFWLSATILAVIALIGTFTLKQSPIDAGLEEPREASPANIYGAEGSQPRPKSLSALLEPLLTRPIVWVICLISGGLTFLRETFNSWTPTILNEVAGLEPGEAGIYASIYPISGCLSVLIFGWMADSVAQGRYMRIMLPSLMILTISLYALSGYRAEFGLNYLYLLLAVSAFFALGPYSLLAGTVALRMGGKTGSASASGLIDAAGYFAGAAAGLGVGKIAQDQNWSTVFLVLTATALFMVFATAAYGWLDAAMSRKPKYSIES